MTNELARWQFATTSIYHFLFVPVTIGLAFLVGAPADGVAPQREAGVQAPDALFRDATSDQCCRRRGDRAGTGVRVRDELVGLLALRGRRLRWPAGDGEPGGVRVGVDLPRVVAVRLGQAPQARAPRLHMAGGVRLDALSAVHPGRQLVDAAPGRLCAEQSRSTGTEQRLGAVHEPDLPVGLRARDPGVARHRLAGDARSVGMASAQAARGRGLLQRGATLGDGAAPGDPACRCSWATSSAKSRPNISR